MARLKQYMWPIWWAVLTILILMALGGCTTVGKFFDYAAAANDEALKSSKFTICNAASVGSVRREFDTPEKAQLWKSLCDDDGAFTTASEPNRQF